MPSDFEEYEIQVMKDGRWNTEAVRNSETLSRQLAKELLGNKQCAGVRIVGNQSYRDGTTNETVIFEKPRTSTATSRSRSIRLRWQIRVASGLATFSA